MPVHIAVTTPALKRTIKTKKGVVNSKGVYVRYCIGKVVAKARSCKVSREEGVARSCKGNNALQIKAWQGTAHESSRDQRVLKRVASRKVLEPRCCNWKVL